MNITKTLFNELSVTLEAGAPDIINFAGSAELKVFSFDGRTIPEKLLGSMEMQHDYKEGSDIELHVHWTPTTANVGNVKWRLYYSWAADGTVFSTPTLLTAITAAQGAWKSTYSSFGTISGLNKTMNSQLVLQLARDPTDEVDTYPDDAALVQVGIHYEVDSLGSRQIATK